MNKDKTNKKNSVFGIVITIVIIAWVMALMSIHATSLQLFYSYEDCWDISTYDGCIKKPKTDSMILYCEEDFLCTHYEEDKILECKCGDTPTDPNWNPVVNESKI